MKKVRALDLFMAYNRQTGEFNFFCGKSDSKQLIDLKGMKTLNNDKEKLAAKGVDLVKVWEEYSFVDDRTFAQLKAVAPNQAKRFLADGLSDVNFEEVSTVICDVTDVLYSVDALAKVERKINKGLERE